MKKILVLFILIVLSIIVGEDELAKLENKYRSNSMFILTLNSVNFKNKNLNSHFNYNKLNPIVFGFQLNTSKSQTRMFFKTKILSISELNNENFRNKKFYSKL